MIFSTTERSRTVAHFLPDEATDDNCPDVNFLVASYPDLRLASTASGQVYRRLAHVTVLWAGSNGDPAGPTWRSHYKSFAISTDGPR